MESAASEYETTQFELPRTWSRSVVRQLLTDRTEHSGWELRRVRLYPNGRRVVTMRRRVIRARKTRTFVAPAASLPGSTDL